MNAVYMPTTVSESLELLLRHNGKARIIAGGTDLVLQQRMGEITAETLVDITNIDSIKGIREEKDFIIIGAATTQAMIAKSKTIQDYAPVLSTSAAEVGSPQIRAVATIGGNVVNAQPAADTALALIALNARAKVQTMENESWEDVIDLYIKPGKSHVDSTCELLVEFKIPKPSGNFGSAYRRLGKCKSIALPVVCAAATVQLDQTKEFILESRIVIGPVAPRPLIVSAANEWLRNKPVALSSMEIAARIARESAHPRESLLRCSAEYREEMVEILTKDVLEKAIQFSRTNTVVRFTD